ADRRRDEAGAGDGREDGYARDAQDASRRDQGEAGPGDEGLSEGARRLAARLSGEPERRDREAPPRVPRRERRHRLHRDNEAGGRPPAVRERHVPEQRGAVEAVLPRGKGSDSRRARGGAGVVEGFGRLKADPKVRATARCSTGSRTRAPRSAE